MLRYKRTFFLFKDHISATFMKLLSLFKSIFVYNFAEIIFLGCFTIFSQQWGNLNVEFLTLLRNIVCQSDHALVKVIYLSLHVLESEMTRWKFLSLLYKISHSDHIYCIQKPIISRYMDTS